ncbi:MAG TPA: hypothetical protein VKM94_13670 [Blastocatellia bacterium]|nr:hypothetical protein [Blastocatellia bacterium]
MDKKRKSVSLGIKGGVVALVMLVLGSNLFPIICVGQAQNLLRNEPPFDFSDATYQKNGIAPSNILARVGTPGVRLPDWAPDDSVSDQNKRGIRIRQITGGWDKDGNLIYYVVPGFLNENSFSRDSNGDLTVEGMQARNIAEKFRAFLFPKTTRNPDGSVAGVDLSVALPNRRQDNIFETVDRYFCENLLGLWLVTFVVYTQAGYNAWVHTTDPNHAILQAIANNNGTDRDGTPILQRLAEINSLQGLGLIELRSNPPVFTGGGPPRPRWVI